MSREYLYEIASALVTENVTVFTEVIVPLRAGETDKVGTGGVVSKELSVAGLTVVLFERGGWATYDDIDTDELNSQRAHALSNGYGPDNERNKRVKIYPDGSSKIVLPTEAYSNNAACVGSGTVSYGAMAWRYMQEDFKLKTTYGHVEGSTIS